MTYQIVNCGNEDNLKKMDNKINNKAQMKIQQMAFMLLAITLFFTLVGVFVLVIKMGDLRNTATELEEKNAMLLVTRLANSPEFSCGGAFGRNRINCIDGDKVMMIKQNIDKYYDENRGINFWGVQNIEIRKIYPSSSADIMCTLGSYPNCNIINILDKEITAEYSNFVSLCRKAVSSNGETYDKCEMAKIMVSYKSK